MQADEDDDGKISYEEFVPLCFDLLLKNLQVFNQCIDVPFVSTDTLKYLIVQSLSAQLRSCWRTRRE